MSFNSWQFLLFFPIVLLLYWLLPQRFRWIMLLVASYIFYISWNVWLIFLILFTTGVSYGAGILIEKSENKKTKKLFLTLTLICCLGVLVFFKYFTFLVNSVIDLINLGNANIAEFTFSLILPVGISFYTFQTLSYVIDVYRGNIKAERHLGYYALYVTYFPQLVAGPIERPQNLLTQLREGHKFDVDDLFTGLRIALVGFFKKVVIADTVAVMVNGVYNNVSAANGLTVFIATMMFAIQIYCDFSGYTDIAIGVARMMGVKLCENFNQPYLATNIKDFWRRWHISLTSWFTDYVYIPLGGSRCKFWRWAINILIVFLLSGLWHGAAWTFVIWGGINGVYQIVGKLKYLGLKKLREKKNIKIPDDNFAVVFIRRLITFFLVCFAWIFFRGNSLGDCGILIAKLFTDWSGSKAALESAGINLTSIIKVVLMCSILSIVPRLLKYEQPKILLCHIAVSQKLAYLYLLIAIIVAWIAIYLTGNGESTFIYFQF